MKSGAVGVIDTVSALVGLSLGVTAGAYAWALVRVRRMHRPFPNLAVAAFAAGLVAIGISLMGAADDLPIVRLRGTWYSTSCSSVLPHRCCCLAPHCVGACGAPASCGAPTRGRLKSLPLRVLTHPAVAWLQFAVVLYGTHFSPLYEAALEHPIVHAFEHALYLGSGLIFGRRCWPSRRHRTHRLIRCACWESSLRCR